MRIDLVTAFCDWFLLLPPDKRRGTEDDPICDLTGAQLQEYGDGPSSGTALLVMLLKYLSKCQMCVGKPIIAIADGSLALLQVCLVLLLLSWVS